LNKSKKDPKKEDIKKKDIVFTTLTPDKSLELNDLLDTIVTTLNGMGAEVKKNKSS
jgi:hypothetical protein